MKSLQALLLVAALGAPALAGPAAGVTPLDSLRRAAVREGWPDTDAGCVAARWVRAFSKDEKAMRSLLEEILTPEALEKRPMPERMASYREMRERFGPLELVKVLKSAPSEVTVQLAGFDMTPREFTFTVQAQKPHQLLQVAYKDFSHPGHGGGFGH